MTPLASEMDKSRYLSPRLLLTQIERQASMQAVSYKGSERIFFDSQHASKHSLSRLFLMYRLNNSEAPLSVSGASLSVDRQIKTQDAVSSKCVCRVLMMQKQRRVWLCVGKPHFLVSTDSSISLLKTFAVLSLVGVNKPSSHVDYTLVYCCLD